MNTALERFDPFWQFQSSPIPYVRDAFLCPKYGPHFGTKMGPLRPIFAFASVSFRHSTCTRCCCFLLYFMYDFDRWDKRRNHQHCALQLFWDVLMLEAGFSALCLSFLCPEAWLWGFWGLYFDARLSIVNYESKSPAALLFTKTSFCSNICLAQFSCFFDFQIAIWGYD